MDGESPGVDIDSLLMPPPPKRPRDDATVSPLSTMRSTRTSTSCSTSSLGILPLTTGRAVEVSMLHALDEKQRQQFRQEPYETCTATTATLGATTSMTSAVSADVSSDSDRQLSIHQEQPSRPHVLDDGAPSSLPDTINFVTPSKQNTCSQHPVSMSDTTSILHTGTSGSRADFSETDSLQSERSTVIAETMSSSGSSAAQQEQQQPRHEEVMPETTNTRFTDIVGHASVKLRIDEMLLPLALPPSLADSILTGVRSQPASLLLYGPPGTGKTQLARAIAGEARAAFISIGPSDVLSKFVGESEASVRSIFRKAYNDAKKMESQCSVLFFDEIDALGSARGPSEMGSQPSETDACSRRVLAELLIQLTLLSSPPSDKENDAFASNEPSECSDRAFGDDEMPYARQITQSQSDDCSWHQSQVSSRVHVIVVAATNRPEDCDPALLRRFSIRANVDVPTKRDRRKIISKFLCEFDHTITKAQLNALAGDTEGWSGSDLESLTREAAMAPIRECLRSAAMLKRRARTMEQQGGDDSGQGVKQEKAAVDAQEQARDALTRDFRQLRPVTLADFHAAIEFWLGNQHQATPPLSGSIPQKRKHVHYDSDSSSSEGEED